MAIQTLTQLLNPPSLSDLLGQITRLLAQQGYSATDWETDSDSRIILQVEAQTLQDLYQQVLEIAQGGYLDTATDGWLDQLALSQYQLTRFPAVQTIGNFKLTAAATAGPYTFNAGDLVVTATGTDNSTIVTYRSTNSAPVVVNPGLSADIQVTADVPSSLANIASGVTLTVATPRPGLTVTNPGSYSPAVIIAALIGGPFYVSGKTLIISANVNGVPYGPTTLTFTANYPDVTSLSNALNVLIAASALNGKVTTTVVSGLLLIQTVLAATPSTIDTIHITSAGTANILIGLSITAASDGHGALQWITQVGLDSEPDSNLRLRCQNEWGVLGAGTKAAFVSWATTADPAARKIAVYSNLFDGTPKAGAVTIYTGPIATVFTAAQSASHAALVYNYINPRMPIMSQLFVGTAAPNLVNIEFSSVTIKTQYNNSTTKDAIFTAIQNYINSLQIGDVLYADQLIAAVITVPGVVDAALAHPTAHAIQSAINEIFTINGSILIDNYVIVP